MYSTRIEGRTLLYVRRALLCASGISGGTFVPSIQTIYYIYYCRKGFFVSVMWAVQDDTNLALHVNAFAPITAERHAGAINSQPLDQPPAQGGDSATLPRNPEVPLNWPSSRYKICARAGESSASQSKPPRPSSGRSPSIATGESTSCSSAWACASARTAGISFVPYGLSSRTSQFTTMSGPCVVSSRSSAVNTSLNAVARGWSPSSSKCSRSRAPRSHHQVPQCQPISLQVHPCQVLVQARRA